MRISWVGVGKLGYPCGLAAAARGHHVQGYDSNVELRRAIREEAFDLPEGDLEDMRERARGRFSIHETLGEALEGAELILCAVQTPHEEHLDGSQVVPKGTWKDFDYSYLKQSLLEIAKCPGEAPVVIVSTVRPGTTRRELAPLLPRRALFYMPSFIAMGTAVRDFLEPEFYLVGKATKETPAEELREFVGKFAKAPLLEMEWASAEMAKVCYNTFIGFKIMLANTVAGMAKHVGHCDPFDVMRAIQKAHRRVASGAYMMPGMGDGGGCHPRDNLVMAGLCGEANLPYNPFDFVMEVREEQTRELARVVQMHAKKELPVVILGKGFKLRTPLTTGSPSVLLGNILQTEFGVPVTFYDPLLGLTTLPKGKAVYVLGQPDEEFLKLPFAEGSILVSPWEVKEVPQGVTLDNLL